MVDCYLTLFPCFYCFLNIFTLTLLVIWLLRHHKNSAMYLMQIISMLRYELDLYVFTQLKFS